MASVGNSKSWSGDPIGRRLLWLAGGDLCGDKLEVLLLTGDDEVEPKVSILSFHLCHTTA